ncbi:MAG TPA: DUF5916 domain-containing protein, partial [Pyrinomonadaceae bacterium]|nr:DUF5916 domain-containing protein [Pyrinomonadaceae bacterium]
ADEAPEGTRVRLTSDAAVEGYETSTEGGKFFLLLPQTDARTLSTEGLSGRGFAAVGVEQRGADALLGFTLRAGFTPRVRASFNRLEIIFAAQQQQGAQGGGASQPASAPPNGNSNDGAPAATPAPNPTPTTVPAAATSSGPAPETPTAPTTEATTANLNPPGTKAARLAALLTPEKASAVKIPKLEKPPVIDGKLDDEVWKTAARFKDFVQYRPVDLVAPSRPTEAFIGYDSKFLYIAFHAFDEPDKVRATIAKRDAVFDDDWVGVWLDTFNDGRRSYELIFNPLGVQADAIFTEGVSEDFSVDIVHESKGSITTDGYVVEVAIPFKSLRYTAGKDKQWGVHFLRTIKRFNNEQSSWMPISRDNSSLLGQEGHITGLEGISAERTLELIPSLTISQTGERVPTLTAGQIAGLRQQRLAIPTDDGRFLNKPLAADIGLTAKFGITPNMTLDFAYNPDFAQVEADATVVTANQRFPIFFAEKRPFFLEGKEIFETLISAVHTRTIVDPDYAMKLTGKQGRNTYGVMFASDNAPGNLTERQRDFILDTRNPEPERESLFKVLDKNATVGVLRLKRDIGKENHIGFLGTTYNFVDKYNHVGGVDARFRLNKTTTITAQVMGSVSNQSFFYPDENVREDRRENGMVYGVYLNNNGRNFGYEVGAVGRSNFFRADVGFNRRFNTHNPTLFVRYQTDDKPKQKIIYWRVYNFTGSNFDWTGRHQRWVNESQLQLRLQRQTWVGIGYERGYERVFEDEFGATRLARRNFIAGQVGPEQAARMAPCDPRGTFAPLISDDPATLNVDETVNYPRCTFFGDDDERSANRNTVYWYVETAPSKKYSANVFSSYNHGVLDFDFGTNNPRFPRVSPAALELGQNAHRDPGAGNEFFLEASGAYQPTDALRLSLNYTKDRLTRHDTGLTAFDDNIFSLRGTYQFTRFWFARARADYTTLGSNVRGQFLLGWAPNPGTSFYVGYNDDLNRNGQNPFSGELEPGFRRNGRLFFIKMSYLFRRSFGE